MVMRIIFEGVNVAGCCWQLIVDLRMSMKVIERLFD